MELRTLQNESSRSGAKSIRISQNRTLKNDDFFDCFMVYILLIHSNLLIPMPKNITVPKIIKII